MTYGNPFLDRQVANDHTLAGAREEIQISYQKVSQLLLPQHTINKKVSVSSVPSGTPFLPSFCTAILSMFSLVLRVISPQSQGTGIRSSLAGVQSRKEGKMDGGVTSSHMKGNLSQNNSQHTFAYISLARNKSCSHLTNSVLGICE